MDLQNFSTVVSLLVLVITWMIVKPLQNSIESLQRSIDKLNNRLEDVKEEVNDLRERTADLRSSASSAHKRLDDFDERLRLTEHKCDSCQCYVRGR